MRSVKSCAAIGAHKETSSTPFASILFFLTLPLKTRVNFFMAKEYRLPR
jgi:hypothetical protein